VTTRAVSVKTIIRTVLMAGLAFATSISVLHAADGLSIIGTKHDLAHLNQRPSVIATGGGTPMEGTAYNNYLDTCVYCHVPHVTPDATQFNRVLPQDNYAVYSNPAGTMDATINRPGGVSLVCLSCHDGTIAVDAVLTTPSTAWTPSTNHQTMSAGNSSSDCGSCHKPGNKPTHDATASYMTQDLRGDHPISISYSEALLRTPDELRDPLIIAPLRLYNDRVECPTCHDVHNAQYVPFLRIPNAQSVLCLSCHIK